MRTVKVAPRSRPRLCAEIPPPWASTKALAIARPIPLPPCGRFLATGHRYVEAVFGRADEAWSADGLEPEDVDADADADALRMPCCRVRWNRRGAPEGARFVKPVKPTRN